MMRSTYILSLLLNAPLIFCAASPDVPKYCCADAPTMYNGQKITRDNLHLLGEPLPEAVVTELNTIHPALTALCRNYPKPGDEASLKETSEFKSNLSHHNKVFEYLSYMLKISGLSNRLQSMLITKDVWPGQWGPTRSGHIVVQRNGAFELLTAVLPEFVETYQTASRHRNFLLCSEVIREQDLKLVKIPKNFIFLLNPNQKPHDENCIILEETIQAKPLERTRLAKDLTEEHVEELFTIVERVGIWTLVKGDYSLTKPEESSWHIDDILKDDAGVLYLIDLEQPNNSNPEHFFDRNNTEHHGNIKSGIEQLAVLCAHDPKKVALLTKLIESSEKINSDQFSRRFKNEIDLALTQISQAVTK